MPHVAGIAVKVNYRRNESALVVVLLYEEGMQGGVVAGSYIDRFVGKVMHCWDWNVDAGIRRQVGVVQEVVLGMV